MIGRISSAILALLVVTLCQKVTVSAYKCVECASPDLRDHWQMTSYPMKYTDDKFLAGCDDVAGMNARLVDCGSPCLEMIIPIDDRYLILRGCLQNLLGSGYKSNATIINTQSPNTGDCFYGKTDRKINIPSGNGNAVLDTDDGYIGIHFCETDSTASTTIASAQCNTVMKISAMYDSYDATDGQAGRAQEFFSTLPNQVKCPAAPSSAASCNSCLSVDNDGTCDKHATTTCFGAYCFKTFGKQGMTEFVEYGCSPINPYGFNTNGSTVINLNRKLLLSGSGAGVVLNFKVDQSFCTQDMCNQFIP